MVLLPGGDIRVTTSEHQSNSIFKKILHVLLLWFASALQWANIQLPLSETHVAELSSNRCSSISNTVNRFDSGSRFRFVSQDYAFYAQSIRAMSSCSDVYVESLNDLIYGR